LGIELWSGVHFFEGCLGARAEEVAAYFSRLATHFEQIGVRTLHIFLDRNPTHRAKMQTCFAELTKALSIQCSFHFLAAYSPKLNLVEYAIHLIRQRVLHHSDCKRDLGSFVAEIEGLCAGGGVLSKDQIMNVLNHIQGLVLKNTNLSP
jgi:hypothetical protein